MDGLRLNEEETVILPIQPAGQLPSMMLKSGAAGKEAVIHVNWCRGGKLIFSVRTL